MIPDWLNKTMGVITWVFGVSILAIVLGVFTLLIPIEALNLEWAKGFEVFYFRLFGVTASMTLPVAVTHFIIWDCRNC